MKTAQKQADNASNRSTTKASQRSGQNQQAQVANNSKEAAAQRALIAGVNDSPRMVAQRRQIEGYGEADRLATVPKPNNTSLPGNLKSGIEALSGVSMDNVNVHYNSSHPAQLNALAYAQGSDIHIAPGQEKHLPHEAWHVAQQAQGRVQPTRQMKGGIPVNDDRGLEHEADVMGEKAMRTKGETRIADAKPGPVVMQRQTPPPAPAPDGIVNQDVREAIINGGYADKGEYKLQTSTRTFKETKETWKIGRKVATEVEKTETIVNSTFTDAALEKKKQYLDANWAGGIDVAKSTGGSGDTKGKHIDMPGWVYEYQNKLAAQKARDYVPKAWEKGNNPNWDKDSFLAQRVLEAFLRAWHKKELPDEKSVPSNIEELYKRTGVSEKAYGNAQATLLGDPNVYGWCGPATYNAVVLGLLKNGLRFNTGKAPVTAATLENRNKKQAQFIKNSIKWKYKTISDDELNAKYQAELAKMAFLEEVNAQAAFFIGNNNQKQQGWLKTGRFVSGADAYAKYEFKSGDVITQALMNGSPVSGHVLTVIKEERNPDFKGEPGTAVSTLYGISGNAGSIGGGSVKIEKFIREMPPASLKSDLNAMSGLGNRMTVAADDRKSVQSAETARLAKEQGVPAHKVEKAEIEKATEAKQGERKAALQARLTTAEADFQEKSGMSYMDYIKAKSAKNPPLAIIQIGRTHKDLIAAITRLKSQIRAIDDYTNVPAEAAAKGVAYSPQDTRYSEQSGGAGRFRPNELGHMWITTIIKAAEYADAHKINADLNLDAEGREKKIKELGWDEKLAPDKYKEMILEKYGMQQLSGSVDALWPGAIAAIEGESLAKDYR